MEAITMNEDKKELLENELEKVAAVRYATPRWKRICPMRIERN